MTKKLAVFLFALLVVFQVNASSPKRMAPTYKVIFYNIENLFDTIDDPYTNDAEFLPNGTYKYTSKIYQTHLDRTSEVLSNICEKDAPLFIGLSEIENKGVLQDLIKQHSIEKFNLGIVHQNSPDDRGIDVGLIYNKDICKVIKEEYLYVSIDTVPDFRTRLILHATFETYNGTILHVYVNHWPSRREGEKVSEYKRLKAAATLKASTDDVMKKDANANIIIMGDFNDYPTNASITQVLGAVDYKNMDNFKSDLYNISEAPVGQVVKGSHFYKGEWGNLDQIILSKNLIRWPGIGAVGGVPYTIYYNEKMLYTDKNGVVSTNRIYAGTRFVGGYSDHLPVYFNIRF
jgi:predicted extracellular nuclease